MGEVDCLDQNISTYMIGHRRKKWWWPIYLVCPNISVNNAYQIYHYQETSDGEKNYIY